MRQWGIVFFLGAAILGGCGPMSDSATHQRQAEKERKANVRALKSATSQYEQGRPVVGDELRALVSGKTHASEYERAPGGAPGPYREWSYFRPDGRFVYMNSLWAVDPNGVEGDTWRVDGDRLCIRNSSMTSEERCFRIYVTPDGRIQYYIANPGDDTDGLLTKIPDRVLDGPPQPQK